MVKVNLFEKKVNNLITKQLKFNIINTHSIVLFKAVYFCHVRTIILYIIYCFSCFVSLLLLYCFSIGIEIF